MIMIIRLGFLVAFFVYAFPLFIDFAEKRERFKAQQLNDKNESYGNSLSKSINDQRGKQQDTLESLGDFDSNLRKCILNNSDRFVHAPELLEDESLANITKLFCDSRNIRSLRGLQKLNKLTVLSLRNNNIDNIDQISKLTELRQLNLANNPNLNSLSPLRSLSKLKKIVLTNNRDINDLTVLTNIKTLNTLILPSNLENIYCFEVAQVVKAMRENNSNNTGWTGISENSNSVFCKGKIDYATERAFKKKAKGKSLTAQERLKMLYSEYDQIRQGHF